MKIKDLDELYPYQLRDKLHKLGVELTPEQTNKLLNCDRTYIYAPHEKKEEKTTLLYRISILILLFWALFVRYIIQPVKWLLTGNEYFDTDNPIYKFTVKWGRKIGL